MTSKIYFLVIGLYDDDVLVWKKHEAFFPPEVLHVHNRLTLIPQCHTALFRLGVCRDHGIKRHFIQAWLSLLSVMLLLRVLRYLRLWSGWRSCARSGQWPGGSWTRAALEWCHHMLTRCSAFVLSFERRECMRSAWKECSMSKVRKSNDHYGHALHHK